MSVKTSDSEGLKQKQQVADNYSPPKADPDARMKQIRRRFETMQGAWSHIIDRALSDDNFVAGKQWPELIRQQREADGRPVLTYNHLLTYVNNIVNRVRKEWPQGVVSPVEADREKPKTIKNLAGTKDYSYAEVYMGIIRHIENVSKADQAYDTAIEHSTSHGFGFFRIITQYNNDDSFEQDIRIKRIKNSYNVLTDLSGDEADFSDMNDAFVFTRIHKDVFQQKYPGVSYSALDFRSLGDQYDGWFDTDGLRIAEYYYIEYIDDELLQLSNGKMTRMSEVKDILDDMEEDDGITIIKRRPIKRRQCMWQKMTGRDILEGPLEIPCSYIPVFPVVGKELVVNGLIEYHSAITHAKDAQTSYNFFRTGAAESVGLAPKAPWLLTDDQVEGHEPEWESANKENHAYLSYNFVENQPPPTRVAPPAVAAAELSNATQDAADMRNIIGVQEASLGQQSNEKSGRALDKRDQQSQLATFVYPDNLDRSIEQSIRVLIELIPRIITNERVQRILLPGGIEDFVKLNESVKDKDTGEWHTYHDIAYGKYDATIDTGPSFQSQREESKRYMIDLLKVLPPDKANAVIHLIVKNMDWPGSNDVYAILLKMLPDELKSEDEKAKDLPDGYKFDEQGQVVNEKTGEPLPPPPPTPEQKLAAKQMEADNATADAKIAKAASDTEIAGLKTEEAKANAALATAEREAPQQDGGDGILSEAEVADMIAQAIIKAMAEHENELDDKLAEQALDILTRFKVSEAKRASKVKDPDKQGETA